MPREVVVLGGGIAGLSSAWHAAERGHAVTVVDRGAAPDYDCCSIGNAGYVCPSHLVPLASPGLVRLGMRMLLRPGGPFGIRWRPDPELLGWCLQFMKCATSEHVRRSAPILRALNVASLEGYRAWAAQSDGGFEIHERGLLMLCATQHALDDEAALVTMCKQMEVPARMLDRAGIAELERDLDVNALGAAYFPGDAHVDPPRVMRWLRGDLERRGVRFLWEREITGWATAHGRIAAVQTTGGDVTGEQYVLAAGSWSGKLARLLGLRLPLQAGRGHSFELPGPPLLSTPTILTEARVALTPLPDRLRVGGTMEIGGLDHRADPRRIKGMHQALDGYLPQFREHDRDRPVWTGLRPCTPDGLPYVGPTQRYPNLFVAAGHAMLGLSLGAVTGQLIGEALDGEAASVPLEMLRVERFG